LGGFETLDSAGRTARAYVAGGRSPGTSGVVVFHPWWGLTEDVLAYADRLAAAGFAAAAPDLFGGQVASTIEEAERLAETADKTAIDALALATIDRLVDRLGPGARLACLGISFGAHWAMWSPARRAGVVASVLYYGTTGGPILAEASVPVLGHFAEVDPFESDAWVAEFEGTLRSAGRDVVLHRYPGSGHWFAEPSRAAYRQEAAELAFERTVAFLTQHLELS